MRHRLKGVDPVFKVICADHDGTTASPAKFPAMRQASDMGTRGVGGAVRQCLGTAGLLSNTTTRDSHTECGWGRVSPEKCLRGMAVHVALDTTGVCVLREPPVSFLKGGAAAAHEVRVYWDRK